MRVLALADEPPPRPLPDLVAEARPEAILLLGDLEPAWTEGLAGIAVPKLGVHGNHDAPAALSAVGAQDVHLRCVQEGGLTFCGFAGCPRYSRDGRFEWTQEEAARLVERLPAAEVLLTHSPPAGVNDEPDDAVHAGWDALLPWLERHRPAWLLHGHTQPPPGRRVGAVGPTRVVHVRGAAVLDLGGRRAPSRC